MIENIVLWPDAEALPAGALDLSPHPAADIGWPIINREPVAPPNDFRKPRWDGTTWVDDDPITEPEQWMRVRQERDRRITAVEWRINRYLSEVRQGLSPTEAIEPLDAYVQALRDIPQTFTSPEAVVWPSEPE